MSIISNDTNDDLEIITTNLTVRDVVSAVRQVGSSIRPRARIHDAVSATRRAGSAIATNNPTISKTINMGRHVKSRLKEDGLDIAFRCATTAFLPLYGPAAALRNPRHAVASPDSIFLAECVTGSLGFIAMPLASIPYSAPGVDGALALAASLGFPATNVGAVAIWGLSTFAGPMLIGGVTGLLTDFGAAKEYISKSSVIQRIGDVELPIKRVKGPAKQPQLKQ